MNTSPALPSVSAMSILPSLLKSPAATKANEAEVTMSGVGGLKVPPAAPYRTDTPALVETTRSGIPSPLMSATTGRPMYADACGKEYVAPGVSVPFALPNRMTRLAAPEFVTARSVRPSPLKSHATMPPAYSPVV